MPRKYNAVMKITAKESQKVNNQGRKVVKKMGDNTAVYATPAPPLSQLTTENGVLTEKITDKDGSEEGNASILAQSQIVFDILKDLVDYANPIAGGDKVKVLMSGFPASAEPVTMPIPGKALIKRIENGLAPLSAKLFVESLLNAKFYKVETTLTPLDETSWVIALDPVSLFKMILTDLKADEKFYTRVTGGNIHGWGRPSEPVPFTAS